MYSRSAAAGDFAQNVNVAERKGAAVVKHKKQEFDLFSHGGGSARNERASQLRDGTADSLVTETIPLALVRQMRECFDGRAGTTGMAVSCKWRQTKVSTGCCMYSTSIYKY